jgi:hypothetical protein
VIATITLKDDENSNGVLTLFHFEHGFNDESRAHILARLLESHLNTIAQPLDEKVPVELVDADGHLQLA